MGSSFPPAATASLPDLTEREVAASAMCSGCKVAIPDWRERLLPVVSGELVASERGELAVRVENPARCPQCGDRRAEIRVPGAASKGANVSR